jgi:membrane-bound metal-dependent hydrolase YbcI (DUF457 family)
MYWGSHLAAGLLIGKLTGDYTPAILGSICPDLDHIYSYARHGFFSSFKKFIKTATNEDDPYDDQRNYLHNLFVAILICVIVAAFDLRVGLVLLISYFVHLLFDAIDHADFFPLFPWRKINLRGPVGYFSWYDILMSLILFGLFIII